MKRLFCIILSVIITLSGATVTTANNGANVSGLFFSSLSYTYTASGTPKEYLVNKNQIDNTLLAQLKEKIGAAYQDASSTKADIGFSRMTIVFSTTDTPNKEGSNYAMYYFVLCDNGMYIHKDTVTWAQNPVLKDQWSFVAETDDSSREYVRYTDKNYTKEIAELLNARIGGNAAYEDYQTTTAIKFLYTGGIRVPLPNGEKYYDWGLCSFELDGQETKCVYLRNEGPDTQIHYYLSEPTSDNQIHWDNKKWLQIKRTDGDAAYAGQYYESASADISFSADTKITLDSSYNVTDIEFSVKDELFPNGISTQVNMSKYASTGSLKGYPALSPTAATPTSTPKPEEPLPSPEPLPADFLDFIDKGITNYVDYSYQYQGKRVSFSKSESEINSWGMDAKVKDIFKGFHFTRSAKQFTEGSCDIRINFRFPDEKQKLTRIYLFSDHMTLKRSTKDGQIITSSYEYSTDNLLQKFKTLFADWQIEDEKTADEPKVNYIDLSQGNYKPQYVAEFEIELDSAQQNIWIGELAENGKVKCKITYFSTMFETGRPPESMVTLSGNGKEFKLMEAGYARNDDFMRYTTERIGITNDTPLPHKLQKEGAVELNWKTYSEYSSKTLTVKLYDQAYVRRSDEILQDENGNTITGAQSPVGNVITVQNKGEMKNLLDKKDTPVTTAPPKGPVFTDVGENHWAYKDIENFYYANIVRGVGNGLFAPNDAVTEEHFGFLLQRLFGYEDSRNTQIPAVRQNVISSLVKAMGLENDTIKDDGVLKDTFLDFKLIAGENEKYIEIAAENGLIVGYEGYLNPNSNLTRAEAITLLSRGIAKIYGITEADKPEFYKFKIQPKKNGYIQISSEVPVEFKLWNGESHDVLVRDKSRLSGKVLFTFGDDAVNDTKVIAVCIVDEDVYTIETTAFDALYFDDVIHFECNANIYKNGAVYKFNQGFRIFADQENDLISIGMGENKILFENITITEGKRLKTPDKQPYEEYGEGWENGKIITSTEMGLFKGEGVDVGLDDAITGFVQISYNIQGNNARITSQITASDSFGTQNTYQIELAEAVKVTDSEITGLFNIKCNGEVVAEKISAKISGIDSSLGEKMIFVSDDEVWSLEMYITEKPGVDSTRIQ